VLWNIEINVNVIVNLVSLVIVLGVHVKAALVLIVHVNF